MTDRWMLYGLVVECDVALPGVLVASTPRPADVRVHLGARPPGAAGWPGVPPLPFYRGEPGEGDPPSLVADRPDGPGMVRLSYAEGIRFHVRDDGSEIWSDWDPPLGLEDALAYLLGPVLGFALRCRGDLAVHASAVVIGGAAWGFVGAGGAGKSTMAAALARAGQAVLTEDVLVLRPEAGVWTAWPAYGQIRLWEDSPALPEAVARALPVLSPVYDKRVLDLTTAGLPRAAVPVPIAGWFALDDAPVGAPPRMRPLSAVESLRTLVQHSYMGYLLDQGARGSELRGLAAVARTVRGFGLEVAEGREGLAATARLVAVAASAT